jgi:hypothetical protein
VRYSFLACVGAAGDPRHGRYASWQPMSRTHAGAGAATTHSDDADGRPSTSSHAWSLHLGMRIPNPLCPQLRTPPGPSTLGVLSCWRPHTPLAGVQRMHHRSASLCFCRRPVIAGCEAGVDRSYQIHSSSVLVSRRSKQGSSSRRELAGGQQSTQRPCRCTA